MLFNTRSTCSYEQRRVPRATTFVSRTLRSMPVFQHVSSRSSAQAAVVKAHIHLSAVNKFVAPIFFHPHCFSFSTRSRLPVVSTSQLTQPLPSSMMAKSYVYVATRTVRFRYSKYAQNIFLTNHLRISLMRMTVKANVHLSPHMLLSRPRMPPPKHI